jgi:putative transposase
MQAVSSLQTYLKRLHLEPKAAFWRQSIPAVIQLLMESEVSQQIDAGHYERSDGRKAYRNGYRTRHWQTPAGEVTLKIPKLRRGTYTPAFVNSTTAMQIREWLWQRYHFGDAGDDHLAHLCKAYGLDLPPHTISMISAAIHDLIKAYRTQPINDDYPFLWLDALDLGQQEGRYRVLLVAIGIDEHGDYRALDFEISTSADDDRAWAALMRRLIARGQTQFIRIISGECGNLRVLVDQVFAAEWQYQRPYTLQDLLYETHRDDERVLVDAIYDLLVRAPYHEDEIRMLHGLYSHSTTSVYAVHGAA